MGMDLPKSKEIMLQTGDGCSATFFDELIVEILARLPVKSLLRFKCLSHSWKTLISDPHFVKLHLHRSSSNAKFTHHRLTSDTDLPFDMSNIVKLSNVPYIFLHSALVNNFHRDPQLDVTQILKLDNTIVGSCNGLLCLATLSDQIGNMMELRVLFWNPATGFQSEMSPILLDGQFYDIEGFGFGYDNVSETYKVIAFYLSNKMDKFGMKLYNSRESCWKEIENSYGMKIIPTRSGGLYMNNTLNWVAVLGLTPKEKFSWRDLGINQIVIGSFDLRNESWNQLLLPFGFDEAPCECPTLGVLNECLCFIHEYKRINFVIWQMKEFGVQMSWTKLIKFSYMDLHVQRVPIKRYWLHLKCLRLLMLCTSQKGEIILGLEYFGYLVYFYKWKGKDDGIKLYRFPPKQEKLLDPVMYVESLVTA